MRLVARDWKPNKLVILTCANDGAIVAERDRVQAEAAQARQEGRAFQ